MPPNVLNKEGLELVASLLKDYIDKEVANQIAQIPNGSITLEKLHPDLQKVIEPLMSPLFDSNNL